MWETLLQGHRVSVGSDAQLWASVCDPAKVFFLSEFSYLLFCNPTHKTKTGTANRWEATSSKPPGPVIMMGQSESVSTSQIIFITLFFGGAHSCCALHQPQQTLSQTGIFELFFI